MKKMYTLAVLTLLAGGLTAQETKSAAQSPQRTTPIGNFEATASDPDTTIDLSGHFADPGDPQSLLSYEITQNSFPGVANVTLNNQLMTIDYLTAGQTTVILEASGSGIATTDTFVVGVRPVITGDVEVATFDDLPVNPDSFWNGSDGAGSFTTGPATFSNTYNPDWFSWSGWAYSNMQDNTTPGYANQYSAFSRVRLDSTEGKNYGVAYASPSSEIHLDPQSNQEVKGFFVTNSTWAALSMKYGDDFSKKFGGADGTDQDWLKLTITGTDTDGETSTLDYYLADYTFEDPAKDHIIETWQWVNLTSLGKVSQLQFTMSSTDNGDWGMNTPAYFCMDNLTVVPDAAPVVARPFKDIYEKPGNRLALDLEGVFTDPDDEDSAIEVNLFNGSWDSSIVQPMITSDTLWIDLLKMGDSNLTLTAISNGKTVSTDIHITVTNTPQGSPYIAEVLEYVPAPSQYMNAAPWSTPSSPASIIGGVNGSLSLGGFGGYVVFRFEEAVENHPYHPYGVDFTIFGNPLPNWSEPGIVSVMKDVNGNGLPDDTWYELAGSDHNFSSTVREYSVTYENPGADSATDIPWSDNLGNYGTIEANSFYGQPYYPMQDSFPDINQERYTLSGTMIRSTVDTNFATTIFSQKRAFGYVDNQFRGAKPYTVPDNPYTPAVENAGGDAFDISWAVDAEGNYVALDRVHFIRVHCAVNDGAGWLGQISTEITGAVLVEPDPSATNTHDLLVIREIPPVLDTPVYQLEVFAFTDGRLNNQEQIRWSSSMPGAVVDEENILHVNGSGELTITASLASNAEVSTSVSTFIDLALGQQDKMFGQAQYSVYPNPARDYIMLKGWPEKAAAGAPLPLLRIFDLAGKQMKSQQLVDSKTRIEVRDLPPGMYMVTITSGTTRATAKFIRQ